MAAFGGGDNFGGLKDHSEGEASYSKGAKGTLNEDHTAILGTVMDAGGGLASYVALGRILHDFKTGKAKTSNAIEGVESAVGAAEGTVKTVNDIKEISKEGSGGDLGSAGATLEAIKQLIILVKIGYEQIKNRNTEIANEGEIDASHNWQDKAHKAKTGVQVAKTILTGIKAGYEIIDKAPSVLLAFGPALDITMSTIDIIGSTIYAWQSKVSYYEMDGRLKTLAIDATGAKGEQQEEANHFMDKKSEELRKSDAYIANTNIKIKSKKEKIAKLQKGKASNKRDQSIAKLIGEITGLETKKTEYEDVKKNKTVGGTDIITTGRIFKSTETKELETKDVDASKMDEYNMVRELKSINSKRMIRQGIHVTTSLAKIGGAIAMLVPTPGAIAGAAVKGSAAAVEASLPAVRAAKQYGRDRAAANNAEGKNSRFDATKSSAAKAAYRESQADNLLEMLKSLKSKDPREAKDEGEIKSVQSYVKAVGVDEDKLLASKNGAKIHEAILKAFSAREW